MFIRKMSFIHYKKFKEPTEISFEEFIGRIGILGNNGSGKSSLLDVIPIALYGVDAITGKKEHLRTQGLDKDAVKLRLEFAHMSKHFIIEREFRGANLTPKAAIFEVLDEVPHMIAQNAKETNEAIIKILGMDYSTFIATVFCKQKELNRIASMLPTERRAFILKLSKVDDIDTEIKKSRELKRDSDKYVTMLMDDVSSKDSVLKDISQLDEDIKIMKSEHKSALSKLSKYEQKSIDATNAKKEYDIKYEKYNELALELKDCKNLIDNYSKDISRLISEEESLIKLQKYIDTQGNELIKTQKETQAKLDSLDSIRPKYLEKVQLVSSLTKIKKEGESSKAIAEDLYKKATSLGFNKDSISVVEDNIQALEKKIDEIKFQKVNKESESQVFVNKINEYNKEIKKIKDLYSHGTSENGDCKCPMCKQAISKEYTDIVESHYKNEINKLQDSNNSISSEIQSLTLELNNQYSLLNESKNKLKNLRDTEKAYNDIVAQYNAMKQQYNNKISEYKSLAEKYKPLANINFNEEDYISVKNLAKSCDEKTKDVYIALDKVKKLPEIKKEI